MLRLSHLTRNRGDLSESEQWLRRAAEAGDGTAMFLL
jgi:TPR repeat protein